MNRKKNMLSEVIKKLVKHKLIHFKKEQRGIILDSIPLLSF